MNKRFLDFFSSNGGITQQVNYQYTSSQNGVAEHKHRHVIKTVVALFQTAHMPLTFWGEAALTAIYLINRLPTSVLDGATPFYKLFGKHPDYSFLRVFGSSCFPWLRMYITDKLQPRSTLMCFCWVLCNFERLSLL